MRKLNKAYLFFLDAALFDAAFFVIYNYDQAQDSVLVSLLLS